MSLGGTPFWKRFFMWDYPRGSVAYDVKVGLILAFIFLTPSWVFRDEPLLDKARAQVVMLPGTSAESRFWLEAEWLASTLGVRPESLPEPGSETMNTLSDSLSRYTGSPRRVVRVEPMRSPEGNVQGFMAVTRP